MRFPPLHEARFVQRLNRFAATVSLDGREVMVHVANSGRMRELLQPGNLCYLTEQPGSHRKTAFDLTLVAIDAVAAVAVRESPAPYAASLESPGDDPHPRLRRLPPAERAGVGGVARWRAPPLRRLSLGPSRGSLPRQPPGSSPVVAG